MPKARGSKSRVDLPFALRLAITNAWVSQPPPLLEKDAGFLDGLREPLDAVRASARQLLADELRSGPGSRSIGRW